MRGLFAALAFLLLLIPGANASNQKWAYPAASKYLYPAQAIESGTLFFATGEGTLAALNSSSGRIEWQVQAGNAIYSNPFYTRAAVYVATYDGNVLAIDPKTHSTLWAYRTGGSIWGSSPIVSNGVLVVGSENGKVYALNATDGRPIWEAATGGPVRSSPLISSGRVYMGSGDSILYSFELGTGKHLWEFETGGAIWTSSPAIYLNTVFVGSIDGKLYAVSADRGRPAGEVNTGGWVASSPVSPEGSGFVYFGSNDGYLYAVDVNTLEVKWKYKTGGAIQGAPKTALSSRGTVLYFGSNDGVMYALRASSGTQIWNYSAGDWAGSPIIYGNFVYFPAYDGKIYCLSGLSCSFVFPRENSSTSDEDFVVNGTAVSPEGIRGVKVRLNEGEWKTAEGTTEWSVSLPISRLDYRSFDLECMATDALGRDDIAPYTKATYQKTEFVPLKEMQVKYPKQVGVEQAIRIEVFGEDGSALQGAVVRLGESEYATNERGVATLAIKEPGKADVQITNEGYGRKVIEIEATNEIGLHVYLYVAVAAIAVIAVLIGLKRRKK